MMDVLFSDRWKAVRLSWCTIAMVVLLVVGLLGLLRSTGKPAQFDPRLDGVFSRLQSEVPSAPTVATPADFLATIGSGEVILHFDVGWSPQSVLSRKVVTSLRHELAGDPRLQGIVVRRVDCTEQSGAMFVAVDAWARGLGRRQWVVGGWGSLVWMKDGKVIDDEVQAYDDSTSSLLARTRRAFGK